MSIVLVEILIVLVLFIANGVFAMSEMAVVSSRKSRLTGGDGLYHAPPPTCHSSRSARSTSRR